MFNSTAVTENLLFSCQSTWIRAKHVKWNQVMQHDQKGVFCYFDTHIYVRSFSTTCGVSHFDLGTSRPYSPQMFLYTETSLSWMSATVTITLLGRLLCPALSSTSDWGLPLSVVSFSQIFFQYCAVCSVGGAVHIHIVPLPLRVHHGSSVEYSFILLPSIFLV